MIDYSREKAHSSWQLMEMNEDVAKGRPGATDAHLEAAHLNPQGHLGNTWHRRFQRS